MMTIAPEPNNSVENPELSDRVRRLLAQAYSRAALPYLTVGLLLIVAIVVGGREIQHHITAIEVYLGHAGKHTAWLAGNKLQTAHLYELAIIGGLPVCIAGMERTVMPLSL